MKSKQATTMDEIAHLAKVSKTTVSRALHDNPLVTAKTRDQVLQVAREQGYVVNRNAQKLRRNRADTIAVVLDFKSHGEGRISDPFIFDLLAGVSEALALRNQDLLLCSPGHSAVESLMAITSSKGADGVMFLGLGARGAELIELAKTNVPFVVWGAVDRELPYCAVGSDNVLGGRRVGRHLLSLRRSRFLFVGNTDHLEIRLRRKGFRNALEESDREISSEDLLLSDFSYATSYEAATELIRTQEVLPDAIFACSDTAAMAVIDAFQKAGIKIGEEISVVGYNDIPSAIHFNPPLTTIHQDVHDAGALLVEKLMEAVEGRKPESVMLETKLIVRET